MTVTRISKIRKHRIFRDFAWPTDLRPFARFNLIYGWNGSGKTTLSSLFRALQERSSQIDGEIEYEFDEKHRVRAVDMATATLPAVRVFNRDFVLAAIAAAGERMEPIFFLGEESVEKQKQVEALRAEIANATTELSAAGASVLAGEKALDEFCINQAKLIKELLTGSGSTYNNYDKRRFKQAIDQLDHGSQVAALLSNADKEQLRRQKDAQPKAALALASIALPHFADLAATAEALLAQSVVSQVLDELVQDRDVGEWVRQGLMLHSASRETTVCRFCGQAIPPARSELLAGHFNDAFSAFQADCDAAVGAIETHRQTLANLELPDSSRLYNHLAADFEAAARAARGLLQGAAGFLESLRVAVLEKKKSPFVKAAAPSAGEAARPDELALRGAIDRANGVIDKHNATTADFEDQVSEACMGLEQCHVAEAFVQHSELANAVKAAASAREALAGKVESLAHQIAGIEREIVEHRRPAEELNDELQAYLGHGELHLELKDTGYAVSRAGKPASDLSEGERTAVAFLYFLKSLQDKEFDLKTGVVVIDDPVSSLDANALFSAFGYMKERTKDAGQLFVLTHNFAFFRQVKNWFRHMPRQRTKKEEGRPARFYFLRACVEKDQRTAVLTRLDPLLEEFESEYHFLFKTIHEEANRPAADDALTQYYGLPNIARRLLEAFLAFRFPGIEGDLAKRMDQVAFDATKKTRILRLLNTYSHSPSIADPGHDPTILSETKAVLGEVLELIKRADPGHYEGLIGLLGAEEPSK